MGPSFAELNDKQYALEYSIQAVSEQLAAYQKRTQETSALQKQKEEDARYSLKQEIQRAKDSFIAKQQEMQEMLEKNIFSSIGNIISDQAQLEKTVEVNFMKAEEQMQTVE